MTKRPIRVLQCNSGSKNFGGVSSFLYNIYTKLDHDVVQFDFLSPDQTTYEMHRDEIEIMGGRIYEFGIKGNVIKKKMLLYRKLRAFLKKEEYQIVHINSGNFFFTLFASSAAWSAGVPVRIIHSHNAGGTDGRLKRALFLLLKPLNEHNATHYMSCSQLAAEYMFTRKTVSSGKVIVVPNGINTKKYSYDRNIRHEMRKELGIDDKLVVGNVARFMKQKNHRFLIDIFAEVAKKQKNAVLLLVGQGELMDEIKMYVRQKGLAQKVLFLGQRNDTEKLYQAMDVFVLPSFHEGFPVTGVEVQCSGLPFVLSDTITREIKLIDSTSFMSIKNPPSEWADTILKMSQVKREDYSAEIEQKGYSENAAAEMLTKLYMEWSKGVKDESVR